MIQPVFPLSLIRPPSALSAKAPSENIPARSLSFPSADIRSALPAAVPLSVPVFSRYFPEDRTHSPASGNVHTFLCPSDMAVLLGIFFPEDTEKYGFRRNPDHCCDNTVFSQDDFPLFSHFPALLSDGSETGVLPVREIHGRKDTT